MIIESSISLCQLNLTENFVTVYDGRSIRSTVKKSFEGPSTWTIVFCNESPKTMDQIKKHIRDFGMLDEDSAENAVLELEELEILYEEKGKYLTLAVPHNASL